jgi:hypothetical protein
MRSRGPGGRLRLWPPPFLPGALCCVVLGLLTVLLWVQSPSSVQWLGRAVPAYSQQGLVYYTVDGVQLTLIDDGGDPTDTATHPITVYVDPDAPLDSTRAELPGPARWLDLVGLSLWFVAAAAVLAVGYARRARTARRAGRPWGVAGRP